MKVFILFILFLTPLLAFSRTTLVSGIYDVDYGKSSNDEILVLLETGKVLKISKEDQKKVGLVPRSYEGESFKFTVDDERYILQMNRVENPARLKGIEDSFKIDEAYIPTTVASMKKAQEYHREAKRGWTEDAQCFNKAMVWKYEWWRKHSLKSMNLFIFFTRTYIRRYNFEWWFHVAPYFHVMDEGKVVERVMDIKYTSKPLPFKKWSDIFMKNDAACRVITKFSDYADYPYTGDCYYMRANMYFYQPADLQMMEAWNYQKSSFLMNEVKGAYEQAYKITL